MFMLTVRISTLNEEIPFQKISTPKVQFINFKALSEGVYEINFRGTSVANVGEILTNLETLSTEGTIDSEFEVALKNL
jgi:hypothetical protein